VRDVGFVAATDRANTRDDNIFPGNVTRNGPALADRRFRAVQPGGSVLLSDDLNTGRGTSTTRQRTQTGRRPVALVASARAGSTNIEVE